MSIDRRRFNPFRLLVLLQFGDYSSVDVRTGGVLVISSMARLARMLKYSREKLDRDLKFLHAQGLIDHYEVHGTKRSATVCLRWPANIRNHRNIPNISKGA